MVLLVEHQFITITTVVKTLIRKKIFNFNKFMYNEKIFNFNKFMYNDTNGLTCSPNWELNRVRKNLSKLAKLVQFKFEYTLYPTLVPFKQSW